MLAGVALAQTARARRPRMALPAHLSEDERSIDESWLDGVEIVGVASGASAPERLVQSVCAWFAAHCVTDIRPRRRVEERVAFKLPALPAAPVPVPVSRP